MRFLQGDFLAGTFVGGLSFAMGIVLLLSQHWRRTTLGVGIAFSSAGLAILTTGPLVNTVDPDSPSFWERAQCVFEAGVLGGSSYYLLGLVATAQGSPGRLRLVRTVIYAGFGLCVFLLVSGFLLPSQRLNEYLLSGAEPEFASTWGFWLFASYYLVIGVIFAIAWATLATMSLDPGERTRALSLAVISVLLATATVLPLRWSLLACSLVQVVGMYGQFRYAVAQGERSAFLSRFLSPQVADLVQASGLASVMRPGELDVTVVACDLRGFTSYAEAVPSQAVIDLLGEYYDAVGRAVAEVDGTIKDYAGDGILVLVGAPLPRADHAATGLMLARRLHQTIRPVIEHWSTAPHPLGIGIGVASGRVTVGAIGSSSRMEYTAVGTPVNLAARLCAAAADGQTLVDQATRDLACADDLEPCGTMPIKGLTGDRVVFTEQPLPAGP